MLTKDTYWEAWEVESLESSTAGTHKLIVLNGS